jgi:HAD superfamily hydrolase (TIGR01509 family)
MKPDSRLYKILEKKSGYSGKNIVYIDDIPENIDEGLKLGWQAFVHKDYETTRKHLIELEILPDS